MTTTTRSSPPGAYILVYDRMGLPSIPLPVFPLSSLANSFDNLLAPSCAYFVFMSTKLALAQQDNAVALAGFKVGTRFFVEVRFTHPYAELILYLW